MPKALYFDITMGVSGDMILASLLDLEINLTSFQKEFKTFKLPLKLRVRSVMKNGIRAKEILVKEEKVKERAAEDFVSRIKKSGLDKEIKEKALKILDEIISAEAKVHNVKKGQVHFHELGNFDTLLDIVGVLLALKASEVKKVYSSPVVLGRKKAFATMEILKGVPLYEKEIDFELTTPTGAALIKNITDEFRPMPEMKIEKIGYGAGTADLPEPNILRAIYGTLLKEDKAGLTVMETNLDNISPEIFELLFEKLFALGAKDVFITPIYMKKNRPAFLLSVLTPKELKEKIAQIIFSETKTFGIRYYSVERFILDREIEEVKTPLGKVRVKKGHWGKVKSESFEYEDIKLIAQKKKMPLIKVYEILARQYFRR